MPRHKTVEDERRSLERVRDIVTRGDDKVEVSRIEEPPLEALIFLDAACPDDLYLVADDLFDRELFHTLSQFPSALRRRIGR